MRPTRRVVLAVLAALAAIAVVAATGVLRDEAPPRAAEPEYEFGDDTPNAGYGTGIRREGWKTDFSKRSVALSEFRNGGPGRDGIPPIDRPRYISQARAERTLADREPVMVVEQGGEVRAYPLQILIWHEIVNDRLGGRPIAVTYCPLCNSAVVFDRRLDGRLLDFGTTGNLRKSDLVMWDRQTESWWQQFSGEALVGKLTGSRLEMVPSQTLAWQDFRRRYPRGDVLARDRENPRPYGKNPYSGYDEGPAFLFDGKPDSRLPTKERVAAAFGRRETVVVPFSRLAGEPVVEFRLDDRPAVVFYERGVVSPLDGHTTDTGADVGTAGVFRPRVGQRRLSFVPLADLFVDRETGSLWDVTGTAVDGPLKGSRLPRVRHDQQFWFALAAFVPDARLLTG